MANDETLLSVVRDLRNWVRAASHSSVKTLLETALPDAKSRVAYQMSDAKTSVEAIRTACKMSPNGLWLCRRNAFLWA